MRLTGSCRASVARLSDYLDRDLGPWERFRVWLHLLFCPGCRALLAGLRTLGPLVADLGAPEAPPEAFAALKGALEVLARPAPPIPEGALGLLDGEADLPLALLREAHGSLLRSGLQASGPYHIPVEVLGQLPPDHTWHWKEWEGGMRMADLLADPARGARLVLCHCPLGCRTPAHRQVGSESLLVLSGRLNDEGRALRPGDWVHHGPGWAHAPLGNCWCLLRLDGPYQPA
jgi:quercetin dioxygenase-like cupin family protein